MSIEHYIVKHLFQTNEYVIKTFDFHTQNTNNIDEIIEGIVNDFTDDKLSELDDDLLYRHLTASKALTQLAWNSCRNHIHDSDTCKLNEKYFYQICHNLENEEFYKKQLENITKGIKYDKTSIIEVISRYLIIFCILNCRERKSELCSYCDNETINGMCNVCGGDSKNLKTNLQKNDKSDEDQSIKMRSISSKISNRPGIKSNISSHWTCNVCTYNQNNNDNINCEACMSSKFAKINSCAFESSYEASNENEIDSLEHVENIFNKHDVNPADNKDNWICSQCTFSNKTTVDFCEICFTRNINKIDTGGFELPEETWCCKRCGENNLFEYYKCKSCRLLADFFNKWRCEQCSYYNDEVAICCGACEIKNPYLIKCNLCVTNLINKTHGRICKQCSILSERSTNNETLDQNNRKTQSETSEIRNVSSKGDQRREKQNEHQINFNNKSFQFTGKKGKESTDDRQMDCGNTGSLTIYKMESETSKSNDSLSKEDQNRGKLNENQIKLNNNGSQNIERKVKVSTEDRKREGTLKIYNVYKTQSETSESDNSLSKEDHNRGKLNENQIKLNEKFPQNVEIKNKNSTVYVTNKINSKQCKNCKSKSCYNNQYWCDKCENLKWFCQNDACNGINFKNEHCKQCKAKKGSDFSNCMYFWMMKDAEEVKLWQCGFCLQFVDGTLIKCNKCLNHRDLSRHKKCKCNWNNLNIREKCDKCGADLKKITTV